LVIVPTEVLPKVKVAVVAACASEVNNGASILSSSRTPMIADVAFWGLLGIMCDKVFSKIFKFIFALSSKPHYRNHLFYRFLKRAIIFL
jgi:hypothetical protein